LQKQSAGTRRRSFIRKISDSKIAGGLEVAKEKEPFKRYGEEILVKNIEQHARHSAYPRNVFMSKM
jgi:hypothetical protein